MPQSENDDIFLEHLEDLKTHEGFRLYLEWVAAQAGRFANEVLSPAHDLPQTNYLRGQVQAYNTCFAGLSIMIQERKEEIEKEEKSK